MIDSKELDTRFKYHKPSEAQQETMAEFRQRFLALAMDIVANTPDSREQSSALTHLEQAQFYVNAAIARRS